MASQHTTWRGNPRPSGIREVKLSPGDGTFALAKHYLGAILDDGKDHVPAVVSGYGTYDEVADWAVHGFEIPAAAILPSSKAHDVIEAIKRVDGGFVR